MKIEKPPFSLADLPREALELLSSFDGLLIVEVGDGYYLYFRKGDIVKALRLKEKTGEGAASQG